MKKNIEEKKETTLDLIKNINLEKSFYQVERKEKCFYLWSNFMWKKYTFRIKQVNRKLRFCKRKSFAFFPYALSTY